MSLFRTALRAPFLAAALLSCAALFPAPASAGETIPMPVVVEPEGEAPFTLKVLASDLVKQTDGTYSLVLKYTVKNIGTNPLAVQGWSATVHADGKPALEVAQAFSVDLAPGKTGTYTYSLDEKTIGRLDPGDLVVMQANTAEGRTWCNGGMASCEHAQLACEAYCSNPLVGTRHGVRSFTCNGCETRYYAPEKCYYKVCNSSCECEEVLDPLSHGYIPWGEL